MRAALLLVFGKDLPGGAQVAALVENFDALLGLLEPRMAETRELHATLVQLERLLEREVPFLELLDNRFELGDRGFEILNCRVHQFSPLHSSTRPRTASRGRRRRAS